MDEWVLFAIAVALLLVGISGYRNYAAKHEGSGPECQSEARQLAKLSPLRLEDCAPVAAVAAPAPSHPAAKIDGAGLAGEISDSLGYSITLSFEGKEIVLGRRLSWLMRLLGLPLGLLVGLSLAAALVPGLIRVLVLPVSAVNFAVYWLSPPEAPGEPSRPFIAPEKAHLVVGRVTLACLFLAVLALVVAAGIHQTLRFSPATASVTEHLHAYGVPLGDGTPTSYHLAAPITDTAGRTYIHVYAREADRLQRIYRLRVREDRLPLAELLTPAQPGHAR